MPNNEMDYSLIHRTPDGNGKILVTTPGSLDKGSWETEAELKTYVNQDVNIAINAINTRVTNIEETLMGENEVTVSYPSDSTYSSLMPNRVPLRALKFAEVPTIRGKSRAWNQLVSLYSVATSSMTGSSVDVSTQTASGTVANADGTFYLNLNNNTNFDIVNGHDYLFVIPISAPSALTGIRVYISNLAVTDIAIRIDLSISNGYAIGITKASVTKSVRCLCVYSNTTSSAVSGQTVTISKPFVRDLTTILSDWNSSDITTANIPLMVQQIPYILKYDAYDAGSLVDTEISGAETVGRNRWDGTYQTNKDIDDDTGAIISGSFMVTDYIKVIPSETYYIYCERHDNSYKPYYYDANKNYVGARSGGFTHDVSITVPSDCMYVVFLCRYNPVDDLSFYKSGSWNGTYYPYKTDTLTLPETVTLRSAGSVADELDVGSGVVTRKIGGVNFEDLNWAESSSIQKAFYANLSDYKFDSLCQALCSKYPYIGTIYTGTADLANYDKVCALYFNAGALAREVYIRDTSLASASQINGAFLYELATPTTESIDPIPYNFLEVEGGGTVETIQTQTPLIDNCLDVTYDIIPQ